MKIKEICLENFRGFSHLHLHFNGKNVVFVGTNGAGKSTILQAAVILLSRVVEALSDGVAKKVNLSKYDIKYGKQELTIKCSLTYRGMERELSITKRSGGKSKRNPKLTVHDTTKDIIDYLKEQEQEHGAINLPVFVSYPVHRSVLEIPVNCRNKHTFNQASAYKNCFANGVDFRFFFEWYRSQEELEQEQKALNPDYQDKQLNAVRTAIYHFLPGFSDLRITKKGKMKMIITKGNQTLEVQQLSNGEKCTMAMVGDLARRLSLANPCLDNPLEGTGIVFIDEIELHLHPAWQREIVSRLEQTFPNIQFIISTHSPQVLGELKSAQIYFVTEKNNGDDMVVHRVPTLFGKDSNLILEQFMGAAEKNPEVKDLQLKLFRLIMDAKYIEARKLMEHLIEILGNDDPNLIKADIILKRKESLGL